MKPRDISRALKGIKSGWIAINDKNELVDKAPSFQELCRKVENKEEVLLVPATENYFGFVTQVHG